MGKHKQRKYTNTVKTSDIAKPVITIDKNEIQLQDAQTMDAFVNMMARIGNGSQNLTEGAEYPLTRLTRNYQLMNSLYRSHWVIRRIIDVVPEDMMKNWVQITGAMEPDKLKEVDKVIRKQKVRAKIIEAMKWSRLYGGAVALIMIEGHDNREMLQTPLDLDQVMPGSFKGLMVLDRWSGVIPELQLISDISDPDFGQPEFYQISSEQAATFKVHHTRLIKFIGRDLPRWERQAEIYWGASEVEHVFDELKKRDNTSWNIASLIFRANINVMKMADLGSMLSVGDGDAKTRVWNAMQAQNQMMSNQGMYIMDKEDEFDQKQFSFGGLSDIYEMFMMDLAGAAEIPVTKLFGRSPAGMNATGEFDMNNYYDMISEKQEYSLRPALDKLLPVIMMSCFGAVPDDFDFEFNPANTSSDDKKADLASKMTTSVLEAYNAGIISQKVALKELKQQSDLTGMWSNISDDDIESADNMPKLDEMSTFGEEGDIIGNETESGYETEKPNRAVLPESTNGNIKQVASGAKEGIDSRTNTLYNRIIQKQ